MLDVLIIGGGPHALTLATLLSHPGHFPTISRTDILEGIQLSKSKSNTGGTKNRKGAPTRKAVEELADPELPPCPPLQFKVVDSYGEWVTLWESQFRALNIPHLRSHTLVHTDPLNKKALQEFVLQHGRQKELRGLPEKVYIRDENAFFNDNRLGKRDRRRLSSNTELQKSLYFSLPATKLSVDFFKEQVHRYGLDRVLIKGTVDKILPIMAASMEERDKTSEGSGVLFFRVLLQSGESIEAKRVVLATGPTRVQMANIPSWVAGITESYPEDRLQHTVQLMNGPRHSRQLLPGPPAVCHTGDRVMVIGGGLTSAHVITIALQQGASHVTWVMRKHLQLKQFDVGDIESLIGRYSHTEHGVKLDGLAYLRQFYNERSLHKRLSMIRQARKGGAVTPEAYALLQPSIQNGRLTVRAYCQVSDAKWCYRNQEWAISLSCNQHWTGDRIWLATGCKLDVNEDPLLVDIIKEFPTQVLDGWPCVLETLQWAPGCPLYLMGQYSALQIGPHAVNLAGGQASSMRIAKDILRQHGGGGEENAQRGRARPDRTKTEEYIQQMRGLMWL